MEVGGREVNVTNLDKVFFPRVGLTKGDLIEYYVDVADAVLHHVARRPMQMKRHPNGVEGDFFYQKRVPNPHPEWLETVHISYPSGNRDEEAFDRPFEFIPDRSPNRHLGFGFGIHACIGRHLAKAEIVAFFREFFKRVDRVELAGKPAWTETSFLGGVKRLPVRYRAR